MSRRIDKKEAMKGWSHGNHIKLATRKRSRSLKATVTHEWSEEAQKTSCFLLTIVSNGKTFTEPFPTFYEAVQAGNTMMDALEFLNLNKKELLDGTYLFEWNSLLETCSTRIPMFSMEVSNTRARITWGVPSTTFKFHSFEVVELISMGSIEANMKVCIEALSKILRENMAR